MGDPDPTAASLVGNIYEMDREGRNRRQLSSDNATVWSPNWSPDDKRIVYHVGYSPRKASVFVIPSDATGRTPPRFITKGAYPCWMDSQTIGFWNDEKKTTFRILLQGGEPTPIYQASTNAIPIMGGDYLFFVDFHKGREGFYVISSGDAQAQNSGAARKVGEFNVTAWLCRRVVNSC